MSAYALLKNIHVATVLITAVLFLLRAYWMLTESPRLRLPLVRILPHVNDTVLLASALGMLWVLGLNPFATGWLTAKLVALPVYIVLGYIALRGGRSLGIRVAALAGAILSFAYILGVAYCRSPLSCAGGWV